MASNRYPTNIICVLGNVSLPKIGFLRIKKAGIILIELFRSKFIFPIRFLPLPIITAPIIFPTQKMETFATPNIKTQFETAATIPKILPALPMPFFHNLYKTYTLPLN